MRRSGILRLIAAPVAAALLPMPAAAANSVAVSTAAKLGPSSSQYGLAVTLQDVAPRNTTYVMAGPAQGLSNEATLRGTFFVDPQGLTMSTTPGLNSFQMIAFNDGLGAGTKTRMIFHLNHATADGWFLNVWHWNDNLNGGGGGFQFSGGAFLACATTPCGITNNWRNNRVDFSWTAGNPGNLTMWRTRYLNGAPDASGQIQMFSASMPGMQSAVVNYVFAGMFTSHDPGTFGTFYLDEFSFSR